MARYYLTHNAVDDLSNIWNYSFEKWSEQQADKYYKLLISQCKDIVQSPKIGKNYLSISPSLFSLKSTRHVIFYRIINTNEVEITRILHERMDLKKRIQE